MLWVPATVLAALSACLLLPPGTARAGPALVPEIGVSLLPLTTGQWKRHALGEKRRVKARVSREAGRTQVRWRVVFLAANGRDAFAETEGVLELSRERSACPHPQLYAELGPPRLQGPSYSAFRKWSRSLYAAEDSDFFREPSTASLARPGPFLETFCERIRDRCVERGGRLTSTPAGLLNVGGLGALEPPPVASVDCGQLAAEEARCRDAAERHDRLRAAAFERRRQRLEREWSCAALVFPVVADDGSLEIVARGRDGFVWGAVRVEPPRPLRLAAWVFAPVTLVGDVGVMSAQAVWTAFWLPIFGLANTLN